MLRPVICTFSQAAPLQAGSTPTKTADTPQFWETALELVRQMRAWPRIRRPRCAEVFRCGFCWFKKRKEKGKKRIQREGCWNLALGWVEVISFSGRGQNPEIDTSRRWRPLWIIKHISTEKKEQRAQREEVTHNHHIWWRTEVNLAQQLGGHDSANGTHLVESTLKASWGSACGGWLVLCCENTLVAVAGGFLWDPLGNIGSLSQAPGQLNLPVT